MIRPDFRQSCILACALFTAGCAAKSAKSPASATTDSTGAEAQYEELDRMRDKELAYTGVETLVRSNNTFAFDLYRSARTDHFVISPLGLADSLALVHAGAGGETAAQVSRVLHVDGDESDFQPRFRKLHDVLRSRATSTTVESTRGFHLLLSSGVWMSESFEPTTSFLRVATNEHLATLKQFDFRAHAGDARKAINDHYADATGSKITEVFDKLASDSQLVVTSAVVFDAPWAQPFERGLTEDASFAAPDGPRMVPMMHSRARLAYFDGDGFQLVELPYADGLVSAWVVVPDEGNSAFDKTLTSDYFEWMVASARQKDVDIRLPRFEVETRHSFAALLPTLGMPDVFDRSKADLSGLGASPNSQVALDDVVQRTRLKVDEDGSEAVATMRGAVTAAGAQLPRFEASRPFLFVVRDNPTGTVISVARVSAP